MLAVDTVGDRASAVTSATSGEPPEVSVRVGELATLTAWAVSVGTESESVIVVP
jgi:hypothetical protein